MEYIGQSLYQMNLTNTATLFLLQFQQSSCQRPREVTGIAMLAAEEFPLRTINISF
jgi:hypothetical protein